MLHREIIAAFSQMYVVFPKNKCTDFYLNVYWTHHKLQVISFKL